MGLFSNNKKPCPICGNATPRLLPTKVEGVPICKECDKKIDLPNGVLDSMTLDDFRRYIDFYNKNQVLRERFHPEYRFGFGAFNTQLVLDVTNGLFRLKDDESTIVFEKSALKSFRITEDKEPLFTGTAAGLVCAESKNPERVRLLAPRIEQFKLQRSDYERIMQAERVQYLDRTNEEWRERERELEFHKPEFRESSPFRQFVVELELDHPYWKAYRNELDAPEFDDDYPSVDSFLHKYDEKVNELHTLARNLMQFIAPGAPETGAASAAQAAAPAQAGGAPSTVEELKQVGGKMILQGTVRLDTLYLTAGDDAPQQNAQKYYKNYRKAKTAEEKLTEQIGLAQTELTYIDSVFESLALAENERDLNEIRAELAEQGYVRRRAGKKNQKQPALSAPLKFRTSDGFTVLVGRNNRQNDKLTMKDANNNDIWFHTKNIPGSHTVLVTDGKAPTETAMEEAAVLAAQHSRAKDSAQVPVDYTQIRYVSKPQGAKPGMVIYVQYKTVYVDPTTESKAKQQS